MKISLSFLRFFFALLVLCMLMPLALGKPAGQPSTEGEPKQQQLLASTLAQFMPEPRPIDLRGVGPEYPLSLPIAKRMDIRRARLHLRATNSVSLMRRSQLQVRLDGQVLAQIPLSANAPLIDAVIELPVKQLKPGYHQLSFAAALHYTEECEDPSSPELWVQIDSDRSWIELEGELRSWEPRLSQLDAVFDAKLWGPHRYTLLTVAPPDEAHLKIGSLAAQGIALRLAYAPFEFRHALAKPVSSPVMGLTHRLDLRELPEGDAVLLGTRDELESVLPAELLAKIDDAFLGIYPLTPDRKRYLIVISGRDVDELDKAAQAFAQLNYPFPDVTESRIVSFERPRLRDYAAENTVYPNGVYKFRDLGLNDGTVTGIFTKAYELHFNLPAALYAPEDARVELKLDFSYGAGLREDSVLNVFLNGRFVNVIHLNEPRGGYFENYTLTIPLRSFRLGHNVISFSASMMPLITGKCQAIQTSNLQFTLFGRSKLVMPNAGYQITMPNLALLARSGFPYTVKHGGSNVAFWLTSLESEAIASAWMITAKLAQQTRLPLDEIRFITNKENLSDSELFVIGTAASISPDFLKNAPLRLGKTSQSPYPLPAGPKAEEGELTWLERVWYFLRGLFLTSVDKPQVAWLTQQGRGLGDTAALMQFQSPYAKGKTVTVLTAETPSHLQEATTKLVLPEYWNQLQGDLALWKADDTTLATQRAADSYTVGKAGFTLQLIHLYSRHPVFWLLSFIVLSLVLASFAFRWLLNFKRRRHAQVVEENDANT